jgi:hypothetical protein
LSESPCTGHSINKTYDVSITGGWFSVAAVVCASGRYHHNACFWLHTPIFRKQADQILPGFHIVIQLPIVQRFTQKIVKGSFREASMMGAASFSILSPTSLWDLYLEVTIKVSGAFGKVTLTNRLFSATSFAIRIASIAGHPILAALIEAFVMVALHGGYA